MILKIFAAIWFLCVAALAQDLWANGKKQEITVTTAQAQGATSVCPSYFAINAGGTLSITPNGATAMNALTAPITCSLSVTAGGGSAGNITVTIKPPVPVVANASITVQAPVAAGQQIGVVTASGGATTFSITGGSP